MCSILSPQSPLTKAVVRTSASPISASHLAARTSAPEAKGGEKLAEARDSKLAFWFVSKIFMKKKRKKKRGLWEYWTSQKWDSVVFLLGINVGRHWSTKCQLLKEITIFVSFWVCGSLVNSVKVKKEKCTPLASLCALFGMVKTWPFQRLLVTSNDRGSKGHGLNHLAPVFCDKSWGHSGYLGGDRFYLRMMIGRKGWKGFRF